MSAHDTPLRDTLAARIAALNDGGTLRELTDPEAYRAFAGEALAVVADALAESVADTTDARKRTIVTRLATKVRKGTL